MKASKRCNLNVNGKKWEIIFPDESQADADKLWAKHDYEESFFPFWLAQWGGVYGFIPLFEKRPELLSGKILELGCGSGVLAQILDQINIEGTLIHSDIVLDALKFAKQHHEKSHFLTQDIFSPALRHQCCDLILGSDISYDDALVEGFIKCSHQALKKGGLAIFHESVKSGRENNFALIQNHWPGRCFFEKQDLVLNGKTQIIHRFVLEKE